jgi:arylsulfatase A-like enzyme
LNDFEAPQLAEGMKALPDFMHAEFDPAKLDPKSKDPDAQLSFLIFDRFVRAYTRDLYYLRAAESALSDGPLPDLLALYLRATDDVQHGFWKFMQPELIDGVTAEQAADYGRVIERYWQWIDAGVGKILSYYEGTDRLVMVVSDHGAGPAVGEYKIFTPEHLYLSGSHRKNGILVAEGPGIRAGASVENASVYDVTPTILAYLGAAVGEDMDGHVLGNLFVSALAKRPVARVATYDEAADVATGHVPSNVDDKALEHLRSLGYIE